MTVFRTWKYPNLWDSPVRANIGLIRHKSGPVMWLVGHLRTQNTLRTFNLRLRPNGWTPKEQP